MAEKIKLSERKHTLYNTYSPDWEFYFDCIKGGRNMQTDEHIFTHRLEDPSDYATRRNRSYFLNYCDTIPKILNSYIFRERVERPPDDNLALFRTDTDLTGTDMSDFVKKAGYFSSVYGVVHGLVDIFTPVDKKVLSIRDEKTGKVRPYCSLVLPNQLVDWSVDNYGEWRWVVIAYTYYNDEDPTKERKEETHYKLITRKDWTVEDQNGASVKYSDGFPSKGTNKLGIVPMATMYHSDTEDNKIGESLIKDISFINRAILNWCSCIDEQIERQTFSQLVTPDDGSLTEQNEAGDDPLYRIGTSSIWTFPHDSAQPPKFISPDVGNLQIIWKIALDHVKEIFRIAGLVGGSGDLYASRSGKSSQISFQGVNSTLAEKAATYQKFENDISKLAYLQLGKKAGEFQLVKYPSSFDVASLSEEIDAQFSVMRGNFSATLNKVIQKNIARRATPLASQVVRKLIEDEIESNNGVIGETSNTQDQNQSGLDPGNTNVDNISNPFRGVQDKQDDETTKTYKKE